MRVPRETFLALPLEVHALLQDVPLRDVTAVDLPGGGPGRTVADVQALLGGERGSSPIVRGLLGLRWRARYPTS